MEALALVTPKDFPFELEVPARHAAGLRTVGHERFSAALFRRSCMWADVVVDVGAHMGLYSMLAAATNPAADVVAVEASPYNAEVLRRNVAAAGLAQVQCVNAAFGEPASVGIVRIQITEASDGCGFSGHPNSPTVETVEVSAVSGSGLDIRAGLRVLVKVDVEGHELGALRGLECVLAESAGARVLVEYNPKCLRAAGHTSEQLLEWLWDHDFRVFGVDDDLVEWRELSPFGFDVGGLEAEVGGGYRNLYCVPRAECITLAAVLHSSGLAGAERGHCEVVAGLVSAGCMVTTVLPSPDRGLADEARDAGSSVALVEPYDWWTLPSDQAERRPPGQVEYVSQGVTRAVEAVDPDVVLSQTVVIPQGAFAAAMLDKPHVWKLTELADPSQGLRLPWPPSEVGELVAALSDQVVTSTRPVRERFFPGHPEAACVIWPVPSPLQVSEARIPREPGRDEDPTLTIGVVGGLQGGKGHDDAIRVIGELAKRGIDARLVCRGEGTPADAQRLRDLAVRLGVADRVELAGLVRDRAQIYRDLDVVAVTSRREAFGRVPFEASDAGVPVVYAAVDGPAEYMLPGRTGLPYEPGDITGLADQLAALSSDVELRQRLVASAREHLESLRSHERPVREYLEVLRAARARGDAPAHRVVAGALARKAVLAGAALVERDAAVLERDTAVLERDTAVLERDTAVLERDVAVVERDDAAADLASRRVDLRTLKADRDDALAARDSALVDRDLASAALREFRGRPSLQLAALRRSVPAAIRARWRRRRRA